LTCGYGFPPCRELVGVAHGLGRAGRRQPAEQQTRRDADQSVEVLLGRRSVEEHPRDLRMTFEQLAEVVGHHAVWLHRRVKAPDATAGPQYVPHANAVGLQRRNAGIVRLRSVEPDDLARNPPERVARIGVIRLRAQGHHARHVAENQGLSTVVDDRRQPVQQRRGHESKYCPVVAVYVGAVAEDADIEGLLDGFEGQARTERAELIEWLLGKGFTVDQIRGAVSPMLLPAGRIVGDDGRYVSARQICDETGIDLELLQAIQRALGMPRADDPDAAILLRADSEAAARAKVFINMGLSREQVIAVTRVLGHGLEQTAEAMRQVVLEAVIQPGATELQLAQAYEGLVQQMSPLLGPLCEDVLRVQLRHTLETEAVSVAERAAGTLPGARNVAVAFADLVGFTRLGEAVPPEELENLASRLSNLAHDVVSPPVRFIKTIGDAVMLVSTDPVALLRTTLELLAAAEKFDDFPQLRIGLASGCAVSRAGDWFGSPVNVASRVTGVARPGTVLVSESVREAIGSADGFSWSFAGGRHLKGVKGEVKLFRARRADAEE
jgi:adenylate cyclase